MMKHTHLNPLMRIAICCGLVMSCFGCNPKTPEPANLPNTANAPAASASDAAKPLNEADLQAKNEELLHAAAEGKVDRVRTLIAEGADVNAKDKDGFPVLEVAAAFAQADVVKVLIDSGADVNIRSTENNRTPLFSFAMGAFDDSINNESKALPIVKMLIEAKADVNAKDNNDVTPLEAAAAANYAAIAEALIAAGADINAQDSMNFSPLHAAAASHKLKALEVLVKAGANVNLITSEETGSAAALHMAAHAPLRVTDACRPIPGIEGAFDCSQARDMLMDFSEGIKLLLDAGANPNQADAGGKTPLMYASRSGYLEGVKALLKAGADAKAVNHEKSTALHYAADCNNSDENNCIAIARLLMDAGVDVNAVDDDGDTALIVAAKFKHKQLEKLFLDAGANPNVKNKKGESPESF